MQEIIGKSQKSMVSLNSHSYNDVGLTWYSGGYEELQNSFSLLLLHDQCSM